MSKRQQRRIRFQARNLCSGCLSCVTVCSLRSSGNIGPESPRIRIELNPFTGNNVAQFCHQCEKPKCVEACSARAITKDEHTGVVSIDPERCDGCRECLGACPFGALFWDSSAERVVKCDTCGGDPACVKACKFEVLVYE